MMVPRDTSQKGEDGNPPGITTPRDNNNNKDNNKDKSQKGEDGNPPGITTPREDDDGYPDLPSPPPIGRYSPHTPKKSTENQVGRIYVQCTCMLLT